MPNLSKGAAAVLFLQQAFVILLLLFAASADAGDSDAQGALRVQVTDEITKVLIADGYCKVSNKDCSAKSLVFSRSTRDTVEIMVYGVTSASTLKKIIACVADGFYQSNGVRFSFFSWAQPEADVAGKIWPWKPPPSYSIVFNPTE